MIETRFKDTEVGRIPEEWEVKTLGEICLDFSYGVGAEAIPYNGKDKYIRITDIDDENGKFSPNPLSSPSFFDEKHVVKENDLLVARTGASVGKSYLYNKNDGNLIYAGFLMRLNIAMANSSYVFYSTKTRRYQSWVVSESARTGQPGLNLSQLKCFQISLPKDKSEQIRIATALSNIDALISELDILIEKKRAIKQGAMQQLLTGKKRLKGFSEPWVEKKMGDCANVLYGFLFTPEYYTKTGKYKVATIGNVQEGKFYPDGCNNVNISSSFLNDYQYLKPGDLLISMTGNVGRVCIINAENYVMNYRVGKIVVNSDLCLQLLFHLLNQKGFIEDMLNKAKGAAQLNISKDDILSYSFLCPKSISEQSAIASVLSSMNEEISSLEAKREKYASIKQGMMQQLLTGKIRLID